MHRSGTLQAAGKFTATVYFRSGNEVVHEEGAEQHGLVTRGTFGPILSIPMLDAVHRAPMEWSRWEDRPNGLLAVFRFDVPLAQSHYSISGAGEYGMVGPTGYHGEIAIDPGSGTILRLVLEADPPLGSLTVRADVMVEYGSVEIGGETYTCPVRSVSYSSVPHCVRGQPRRRRVRAPPSSLRLSTRPRGGTRRLPQPRCEAPQLASARRNAKISRPSARGADSFTRRRARRQCRD